MVKHIYTSETIAKAIEMYNNNEKNDTIIAECGISSTGTLYRVLRENGVVLRNPDRTKKEKKCQSCGGINPRGAKFCMYCGKRLLTDDEIIIENLKSARQSIVAYVPETQKTKLDFNILAAIRLLEKLVADE